MLNKCKVSCRIDGCNKWHHALKNKDPKKAAANEQENEGRKQNSLMHNQFSVTVKRVSKNALLDND